MFSPSSVIKYRNDGKSEGKFDLNIDEEGEYRVCFRSGDRQEKFVSFDLMVSGDPLAKSAAAVSTSKWIFLLSFGNNLID